MNTEILYSIIIPHYNTPKLLQRLVDSIPQKDDIEVIIVDDNSDEGKKPKIVRENVNTYYLDAEQSKGAGRARNIGLKHAKGRWLLFADSDDFFVDGMYEILREYSDNSYDMIMFKADSVDSDTLQPTERNIGINGRIDAFLQGTTTAQSASLAVHSPWSRMIRRDFVEDNNITFDEVIASNDTMFTTKATCLAKSIGISDKVLYTVTLRQGSLWNSRKNPNNYLVRIGVHIKREEYLSNREIQSSPLILLLFKMGYVDLRTNMKAFIMVLRSGFLFKGSYSYLKGFISRRLHS